MKWGNGNESTGEKEEKRGRPKRRWLNKVKDDIKEKGLPADDVYDRVLHGGVGPYVIVHRPHIKVGIR